MAYEYDLIDLGQRRPMLIDGERYQSLKKFEVVENGRLIVGKLLMPMQTYSGKNKYFYYGEYPKTFVKFYASDLGDAKEFLTKFIESKRG